MKEAAKYQQAKDGIRTVDIAGEAPAPPVPPREPGRLGAMGIGGSGRDLGEAAHLAEVGGRPVRVTLVS